MKRRFTKKSSDWCIWGDQSRIYHSSIQLHHCRCLAPLKHKATSFEQLYHTKSQSSGWNISCLTCKLFIYKMWYNAKTQSNGWNIGWLANMHFLPSIYKNVVKCQVPIGWTKQWLLNMQTGHLQNVCGHHDLFNFPAMPAIASSNSCALASHCHWVW
jgi:hypothetical protein